MSFVGQRRSSPHATINFNLTTHCRPPPDVTGFTPCNVRGLRTGIFCMNSKCTVTLVSILLSLHNCCFLRPVARNSTRYDVGSPYQVRLRALERDATLILLIVGCSMAEEAAAPATQPAEKPVNKNKKYRRDKRTSRTLRLILYPRSSQSAWDSEAIDHWKQEPFAPVRLATTLQR